METKLYIPDIECESCVRLLTKKFKTVNGVHEFLINTDSMDIKFDEQMIKAEDLVIAVEDLGFRASVRPFERKTFKERIRDFGENRHKYVMHKRSLTYAITTFLILVLLESIAYLGFLQNIPGFFGHYAWWVFYLDISVASLAATIYYMTSYKTNITMMTGMMLGMTVGMQAGMMLGAVVGATNGFFTGAMAGMLIGAIAGTIAGSVCGVMGWMQGMMSGVMGGTMGAMISVMMYTDHIVFFMPFFMILNLIILFGLVYMYYEEAVEGRKDVKRRKIDFASFASVCIIITFVLLIIMLYGPKTALFAF